MKKTLCSFLFAACLCGVFLTQMQAAMITIPLTIDNCTGGCGPQATGFGEVDITTLSTSSALVTVNLFNNNKFVNTGLPAIAFDLVGNPAITYSLVDARFTPENIAVGATVHDDGFGNFNYALDCVSCGSGGSNPQNPPVSFTIATTGGGPLTFGSNGTAIFAVDIISGTTGKTGPVGGNTTVTPPPPPPPPPPPDVPEPSTGLLALPVLIGAWFMRRRKVAAV